MLKSETGNIGIMLTSLDKELFLAGEINMMSRQRVVFYENATPYKNIYSFPILSICDAYGFRGSVIATNLSTAEKLAAMPIQGEKVFYVRSLDWTKLQNKNYEQLKNIFSHPFKFIASSVEIANILNVCWDVEAEVVPELSFVEWIS